MSNVVHPTSQQETTRVMNWRALVSGPVLGALPFFLFVAAFLFIPIVSTVIRAFQTPRGVFTFNTMAKAVRQPYRDAFILTINLSLLTAFVGAILGVCIAWAIMSTSHPAWLRSLVMSFSSLASQSGGVQLAYAFIALLGTQGVLTGLLNGVIPGFSEFFSITNFWGVATVYLYFQIPLMTILMLPALGGLRHSWQEAAVSLGASRAQYVRDVIIPVLWPSMLGSFLLLFANAFAAYATAYALASGSLNLIPIRIGSLLSGNVMLDPGLASALVTWMMLIILLAMAVRFYLTRKSEQWLDN